MTVRTRTPISDYYQHKEKMRKMEQTKFENNHYKAASEKENNRSRRG